jgi:hypothetical protein
MGFFSLLPGRVWAGIGIAVALAAVAWGAYLAVDSRGFDRCTAERDLADYQVAEEAHQYLLAEQARGDAISAELAKTQRRLSETKSQYLAYAYGITGNCPASLGLFLGTETAAAPELPATPGASADSTVTVDASEIAANIAENRFRFELNHAQCAALVNWHTGQEVLK